eukprot:Gb_27176 [translate_table: standard]
MKILDNFTCTTLLKLLTVRHTRKHDWRIERFQAWTEIQFFIRRNREFSAGVLQQNRMDPISLWDEGQVEEYACLLKSCCDVKAGKEGKRLHAHIIKAGNEYRVFLVNHLITMYSKCGNVVCARQAFDKMSERNAVSWTAMIAGYTQNDNGVEALRLFCQMQREGIESDRFSFSSVLRASAGASAIQPGEQLHAHVIKMDFEGDVFVGSALVDMYAKCGSIEIARKVFDKMPERNVVSWTAMIAGYAQNGHGGQSLKLLCQMQRIGVQLNLITFASVLIAFASPEYLDQGRQVHGRLIKAGLESDVSIGNALVTMYAKCGSLEDACHVFNGLLNPNMVSWTAMIAAYVQHEHVEEALAFFIEMQDAGKKPNQFTFASVLKACAALAALEQGRQMHSHVIKTGIELDVFVGNAIVTMYAKCGNMDSAEKVFEKIAAPNMVSYTALIAGYAQNEHCEEALNLFGGMQQLGMIMDEFVFATVLSASASLAAIEPGNQVHTHVIKTGFESDVFVGNALVDMYIKCGNVKGARKVFDKMLHQDAISWNSVIAGYTQNGHGEKALKLFCQMHIRGIETDQFTFASVLSASASLAAVEQGKQVHAYIIKTGCDTVVSVGNSLVDMYAKGGSIEEANKVFVKMFKRDVVSFNVIIAGYAQHGCGKEALHFFEQMRSEGIQPNSITFISVLSACSHVGLVNEGRNYFDSMSQVHDIKPRMEHYACMVDLLSRAGCLDEVEDFISNMPFEPGAVIWRTLLGACRIHGNLELGKRAAECALELEPDDAATYVLLSNMFAAAGMRDDATKVRKMMRDRGVRKEPGQSWIEVKDKVHAFVVGDRIHPQTDEIYAKLQSLTWQMKVAGYVPNTNFVFNDHD